MVLKSEPFNKSRKEKVQVFEVGPRFNQGQTVMCYLIF